MTQSFKERVFVVVKEIKPGTTLTYKEVALKAGNPHAARAVGAVLRTNYDLAIPCHRVIRSDGGIGGYNRGGVAIKKRLLLKTKFLISTKKNKNNQKRYCKN